MKSEEVQKLEAALYAANSVCRQADAARREAEKQLAEQIAKEIGLSIGCVIVEKKSVGYGQTKRIRESRYRVESFRHLYTSLTNNVILSDTEDSDAADAEEDSTDWRCGAEYDGGKEPSTCSISGSSGSLQSAAPLAGLPDSCTGQVLGQRIWR